MLNINKLNKNFTRDILDITDTFNDFAGITQTKYGWEYHREDGAEVLDINFRLKIDEEQGLVIQIEKSFDKDTIGGGHYAEDTQTTVTPEALWNWLEDNKVRFKESVEIAQKLFLMIENIFDWESFKGIFYTTLYSEYDKHSVMTAQAVEILLEKCESTYDKMNIQDAYYKILLNEEGIAKLF